MKYYIVEISDGDAKIKGKSVYDFNSEEEAEASFHSKLGTAMKSDMYTSELIFVTDEYGNVLPNLRKRFDRAEAPTEE